jgi:hypothetical protein
LQLYNKRQKAVANIAASVVMLTPNNIFLRLSYTILKLASSSFMLHIKKKSAGGRRDEKGARPNCSFATATENF